jgi:voltage-gated potassium channel
LIVVFFRIVGEFLKNSHLDEILGVLTFIIVGSTLALYFIDPTMNNVFDNLWFVIVSITTVGYGDITPSTVYGKIFSLILLIIGVFMFSAITGAISSYFMDNVLQEGTYHIHDLKEKAEKSEKELEKVTNQLKESDKKIDELKDEIKELKRMVEKNS